jgi:hypothetical protein
VNQSSGVLQRVVVKLLALALKLVNQSSVAIEVLNASVFSSSDDFHMFLTEGSFKDAVNLNSMSDFSLEGSVVFWSGILHNFVVKIVKLDISGINSKCVLSFRSKLINIKGIVKEFKTIMDNLSPEVSFLGIFSRHEISDWLASEV